MADLDASYSGITSMMEEIGHEETLNYLQQEWALQISRKQIAEQQLKEAEINERLARTGLAHLAKAMISRKIKPANIIHHSLTGEGVEMVSINGDQVIRIVVNVNTAEAFSESFQAFILTKNDDENGKA